MDALLDAGKASVKQPFLCERSLVWFFVGLRKRIGVLSWLCEVLVMFYVWLFFSSIFPRLLKQIQVVWRSFWNGRLNLSDAEALC